MNTRSRSLLNLAHRVHKCMNCGRWSEHGCEPAHENGISAGKGQSIKSHDHRHAALCHECHRFYDSGGTGMDPSGRFAPTWADKREMWQQAHAKTMDHYWSNEWLRVA